MKKILRISTVSISLDSLLKGQLHFLNQHFEVVAVSGEDTYLQVVAKREKVRVVPLAMQRAISPIQDIRSLWKLYRLFQKERPQIVHSMTPKAGLLSMLAAKMAGVPIRMHTFTGLLFPTKTGFMRHLLLAMDQLLCWAATQVYPEGNGVKNDLIAFGITSKPLKVLANGNINGIDTTHFHPHVCSEASNNELKKSLGMQPNDFVFVFVGRLVGDKGINELIAAFSSPLLWRGVGGEVKLLLVGPYETHLDPLQPETLKEIETNPHIISVGFQADVRPYFALSDCLVFPSYREGFPNVVMQAGAMGLPSIVTDINGCNEIITEGINGTIIPPKDSAALQQAMAKMLADAAWRRSLQQNARTSITSRYEQKVVWEALLAEYRRLLTGIRD